MFLIKSFNEKDEDVVVVISDIIEQIKQCEKLYLQDRLSQAVELLRLIDIKLENLNSEMRIAVLGEMNKSTKLTVLRKEGESFLKCQEMFLNSPNTWNLSSDGSGQHGDVSVETHLQECSGHYFCRISGKIRVNLLSVVAAILETGLHSSWIPLCTGCTLLKVVNKQRAVIRSEFDFVFEKKNCTLSTVGDVLPDGSVLIQFEDASPKDELNASPLKSSMTLEGAIMIRDTNSTMPVKTKRLIPKIFNDSCESPLLQNIWGAQPADPPNNTRTVQLGSHSLRKSPIEGEREEGVYVQLVLKMDPSLGFPPDWIFNMAVRSAISMTIPMLEHQARLFEAGSMHHSRMTNGTKNNDYNSLFMEIESRINEMKENESSFGV